MPLSARDREKCLSKPVCFVCPAVEGSKQEVIQITSHSPSTRRRILTKCVAARPTFSQPSPHPGVVAVVLSMSTTRGQI